MTIDYLMMGILCFILGIVFGASGLKMVEGKGGWADAAGGACSAATPGG